ncbi:CDP-glucose 4,6-dehydratase [bacterium]|nr:CDP-glucose 4,6-dehydratase [bacterium]
MNRAFWNGKKVFLTGHTGFKGSWFALWLADMGASVTGYALAPPTEPSNFVVSGVQETLARHHEADLRDHEALVAAVREAKPDVVFHLAAQPLVRLSYREPRETFDVNVMGTVNLLEAVRLADHPCTVVVITSDKCYENREHIWGYRECDAMGGYDPYSASKGAAEIVVSSYRRSFFHPGKVAEHGIHLASARAGNVIGGGDWAVDRIVTDMVQCLSQERAVEIRNPQAIRPWQHVLEPLSGYLLLAEKMHGGENAELYCDGWNFGPLPGNEATVRRLADAFVEEWGSGSWDDQSHGNHPHEAGILRLAIEKAISKLDWYPRWNFGETIRRTSAWYRRYYAGEQAMRDACLADIQAYESA